MSRFGRNKLTVPTVLLNRLLVLERLSGIHARCLPGRQAPGRQNHDEKSPRRTDVDRRVPNGHCKEE